MVSLLNSGPFINFLLHNHFITEKILKKKSGDVNDEANFSLFILLHKRAKPILPPWARELKTLTLRARTQTLYSPLRPSLRLSIRERRLESSTL